MSQEDGPFLRSLLWGQSQIRDLMIDPRSAEIAISNIVSIPDMIRSGVLVSQGLASLVAFAGVALVGLERKENKVLSRFLVCFPETQINLRGKFDDKSEYYIF